MEDETPQERQQNELEVLKAIFTDQFINCNEANATWTPLDVIVTVVPQKENSGPLEIHAQLDLHVIACEEYPNKVPKIMLEKPRGLSDRQVAEILTKLEELANSRVGEVMIFELVSYVQTVLTECNKPSFQSCYEEMLSRQKEQKQKEVELRKTEEDMKRQLIELEVKGIKKERQKKIKTKKSVEGNTHYDNEADHVMKKLVLGSPVKDIVNINKDRKYSETCNGSDESFSSTISYFNLNSRLIREFEILNFVGKGAFGDVLKVRNKLDDCLYAIKRIQLKLKNKQMNKKITREVKLLSRLNHENVVRYYNSWLENSESLSEDISVHQIDGFEDKVDFPLENKAMKSLTDNLNLSFPHPGSGPSFSDEDEDDEDDEDDDWIEFIEQNVEVDGPVGTDSSYHISNETDDASINQFMYIQMEYCEKSTLRNAIDGNLYQDENRVWRLLKEVVEGLAYIHEQGIIHRDLKPVNIFIDFNDHVKIGDFGLATPNKSIATKTQASLLASGNDDSVLQGDTNASHTGQVGTALYVAPELNCSASKIHYNQKVDIYSLGIIFFEMCYPPLQTQMERFKILTNLRKSSRDFPPDFLDSERCRQIKLIRELLNHNSTERPSAAEILLKEYIPLAELEDEKINETIRHTLCNPQSKMYKHLIAECFNQKVSAAEDITFNVPSHLKTVWQHAFVEKMADHARKIFRLHGGIYFSTPYLTPNNGVGLADTVAVSLMTRFGNIITAPYDLRLSFARYLAQNPHITHMKRYTVDRVFRERRMLGVHPKENFECTFDIVSPNSSNLAMEAEILSIASEFLENVSDCFQKNYVIRLNHVSLVTAILYHHQVVSKKHQTVCNFLSKLKFPTTAYSSFKINSLNELPTDISDIVMMNLINSMNVEVQPGKFSSHFNHLLKKNTASSGACRVALVQLENLIQLLTCMKIKCPIVIAPNVITNLPYYSGIMFQIVWEHKNKNNCDRDIIAAGGRYDNLIMQYRNALNVIKETKQSAVGLSIYLDRLGNALQPEYHHFSTVDVLVCSVGSSNLIDEKLKIIKELWTAEIRSTILNVEQSLEETQEYCCKMKIPYILYLKETEPGMIRLRSWTREKLHEKKLTISEIVPHLKRIIKSNSGNVEHVNGTNHHHSRSESRSASVGINETQTQTHNVSITFLTEEKFSSNNRKRYENQAFNSISNYLPKISTKTRIELIILNTPYEVLGAIVSVIDLNSKTTDHLSPLIKKYPKYKKCLNRVSEHIEKLQALEHIPVIIFYTTENNNCKILI
ncbi:eIF-2-alpha kinase GCN2 isoform X2 [Planococcus citri]|uniref:eIF-2-alpha kinase GCN2 isoform X2 n=1 Tax=Planococcus citri TaxID=170843 RepID=UPI0031F9BAD5